MAEYIEREAAIKCVEAQCVDGKMYGNDDADGTLVDVYELIDALSDIPAADVAPVRRARWNRSYLKWPWALFKIKNPYCFCTNCICAVKAKKITKYCPNCGAKMDGEEHGET